MTNQGEMLANIWLSLKPYIDKKEAGYAAVAFLNAAEDFVDLEACRLDAIGTDSNLDSAFSELLGNEDKDEDEDEEY